MQAQYFTSVVDNWSELKSHHVETQSCLPTSKTEQIAGCLAPSSSCKFKKLIKNFSHVWNPDVHEDPKMEPRS